LLPSAGDDGAYKSKEPLSSHSASEWSRPAVALELPLSRARPRTRAIRRATLSGKMEISFVYGRGRPINPRDVSIALVHDTTREETGDVWAREKG